MSNVINISDDLIIKQHVSVLSVIVGENYELSRCMLVFLSVIVGENYELSRSYYLMVQSKKLKENVVILLLSR